MGFEFGTEIEDIAGTVGLELKGEAHEGYWILNENASSRGLS
jgi:hypothetical protein